MGAGFFGATFARLQTDQGRSCLVIDRRDHVAGNAFTYQVDDIHVHRYGPHIFHTNDRSIWEFVNRFSEFVPYVNRPKVSVNGRFYSLPFNMNTFHQIWGVTTPQQAQQVIESQRLHLDRPAGNLEEQALSMVGHDIYNLLIRDYTQKQWQRHPRDLPPEIIRRLPLRFTWDDNYFNDRYQGIPEQGYTNLILNMLSGIETRLGVDYLADRAGLAGLATCTVYTGGIDEYYGYDLGELEYRGLEFETDVIDTDNYQGTAVVNYPDLSLPYTRIIEHRHFSSCQSPRTVVTREIPCAWQRGDTAYYPINDERNQCLYTRYRDRADQESNVIFGGRLAEYRYYDMHQVIGSAMAKCRKLSKESA